MTDARTKDPCHVCDGDGQMTSFDGDGIEHQANCWNCNGTGKEPTLSECTHGIGPGTLVDEIGVRGEFVCRTCGKTVTHTAGTWPSEQRPSDHCVYEKDKPCLPECDWQDDDDKEGPIPRCYRELQQRTSDQSDGDAYVARKDREARILDGSLSSNERVYPESESRAVIACGLREWAERLPADMFGRSRVRELMLDAALVLAADAERIADETFAAAESKDGNG